MRVRYLSLMIVCLATFLILLSQESLQGSVEGTTIARGSHGKVRDLTFLCPSLSANEFHCVVTQMSHMSSAQKSSRDPLETLVRL